MNERLKEFEKQSKLEIYGMGARKEMWNPAVEKFAGLVTSDCIQTLRNNGYDDAAQCLHDVYFGMDNAV